MPPAAISATSEGSPKVNSGRVIAFENPHAPTLTVPAPAAPRVDYIRRRGSLQQGRALEALGHAVEYLVDCGMFQGDELDGQANQAAVQILMRLSRAVFLECPEVLPVRRRVGLWGQRVFARAMRRAAPGPAC